MGDKEEVLEAVLKETVDLVIDLLFCSVYLMFKFFLERKSLKGFYFIFLF